MHGSLVKWLNTLPSQGSIHGFKSRTSHHLKSKKYPLKVFFFYFKTVKSRSNRVSRENRTP